MDVDFYAEPGPLTELAPDQLTSIRALVAQRDPLALCRAAQGLLVSPLDAVAAGLSEQRLVERDLRPARVLVQRAAELGGALLGDGPRPDVRRVVGTCRHYAVLATAFMRAAGVPARARCGFASYFVPGRFVDHWVVEHWTVEHTVQHGAGGHGPGDGPRWIRTDPEYVDRPTPGGASVEDLRTGEFLTGGEAWQLVRSGQADPADFGVFGTSNWGPGEIRGNAMRDLASVLRKVEMLPWDEWGPMPASYEGTTGEDFDRLIDRLADACRDEDRAEMERVDETLAVPSSMIC